MISIEDTRDIGRSIDEVFAYVADFGNAAEWDPGLTASHRLDDGPVGVGSRFAVTATFAGRSLPLEYEITRFEPPSLVVLGAESSRFRAVDTIEFTALSEAVTRVRYRADFELSGIMGVVGPLLKPLFTRLGVRALDGLASRLG
jgi:hypothetical protein